MHTYPNFIHGQWVASSDYSVNINPSDLSDTVGHYSRASEADIEAAIDAAQGARLTWGRAPAFERASVMHHVARELYAQAEALASLLAREEGKTLAEAAGEVRRAAATFDYYGYALTTEQGAVFASQRPNTRIQTRYRPVGVVAVITPWNFPLAVPAWKIAPALAYGNSVIFKPGPSARSLLRRGSPMARLTSSWVVVGSLAPHLPGTAALMRSPLPAQPKWDLGFSETHTRVQMHAFKQRWVARTALSCSMTPT